MALSIIGTPAAVTGTTITLPTHAVGDLIVIFAYKDGATSVPTKPAASGTVPAWVTIDGPTGANTNAAICCQFVATATNHTSGTWTGATGMAAIVIRGQHSTPIGGHAQGGSTGNATTQAPTVTLTNSSGSSMLLHFVAHRTVTAWSAAPAGYTRRASVATEIALNTKDTTTTAPAMTQAATTTNSGYRGQTVEVLVAPATVTGAADITVATDLAVAGRVPQTYLDRITSLGPVMHLRLGEAGAASTAVDETANANDGTYQNTPTLGVAGALTNDSDTAVTLASASSEYITVADDSTLAVGDTFTLEAWLKISGTGKGAMLSKGPNCFQFEVNRELNGQLSITRHSAAVLGYSTITVNDGNWHHCVWTKNGSTNVIYIDGVDRTGSISNATILDNASQVEIGRYDGSSYLNGSIDEVAIYDTVLSAADVLENYEVGITGIPAPTVTGAVDITVATALDVAARNQARAHVDITVGRVLDAAGRNHAKAIADTARTVTLDTAARNQARAHVDTTRVVTLDVAGRRTVKGAADTTVAVTLDTAARNIARGAADTTVGRTLDAAGRNQARGIADTARAVTLDAAGRNQARGVADTAATASLDVAGRRTSLAHADHTATVELAAAGTVEAGAEDVFGAADTLISVATDAQGRQDAHGALDLTATPSVAATGTQAVRAAADTTALVELATAGVRLAKAAADTIIATVLELAGRNTARATADHTASVALNTASRNQARAAGDLTATVELAAAAYEPPPAFPTTGVLDSFNRADGAIGANWSNDTFAFGATAYTISGNQVVHPSDYGEAWWNASTFGPDCEAYVTIGTLPDGTDASVGANIRLQNPGTSGADGYRVNAQIQAGNVVLLRMDNGAATTLETAAQTWAAGDKVGIEAIGDTIKVYRWSAGVWTELLSATDTTYPNAGHIGMWSYEPGVSYPLALDDFGGGTVVAAPVEVTGHVDHTATATLDVAARNTARAAADTVAVSSLDAAARNHARAAADTTAAVALDAVGRQASRATADHTATVTLDTAGRQTSRAAADTTTTVALAAAARNATRAAADTTVTVDLDATADIEGAVFARADHTITVSLDTAAHNHARTSADTSATVELAAAGDVVAGAADVFGAVDVTITADLNAQGRNQARAAADHTATVSLEAAGVPARTAAADTTIATSLDTAGRQRATGHLAYTTTTSLNTAGYQTSTGTADLTAQLQLAVAGFSFAGVVGRVDLTVTVRFLVANIYGSSTLTTLGATTTRTRTRVLSPEYANEHHTATIQPSEEPDTAQTLTTRRTSSADALVRTP